MDKINGLFKKEGTNVILPDGTQIPYDKTRPFKTVVDTYHQSRGQTAGVINLPPGTHTGKKEDSAPEVQTSFGKLEEVEYAEEDTFDCDIGKRTRSGAEYPEEKENPVPKKVKILTPHESTSAPTKEKPARKTYVERPLATQFPDTEEKLVSQMLNEKIQLTIGEVFTISNGAVDAFKKKISPKRVPIDQPKTTNAVDVNSEDEEEEAQDSGLAHYACLLGYVAVTINTTEMDEFAMLYIDQYSVD
ncbi:hypothetical protein PTTG_10471 [Puccinia triticina 1-1 BBBD Race 1]|uniref:Uncharacterized protein n=1 Tax=Puccinia triticina (isolate 1-1 / race 1 (BBBD)) TaxID=630390 RepID=A0A180H3A9_PUCT1|nr:hypothetical protein PTTG_10471 [Puccinia triticina 1-1 BBBD Race 1]